MMIRVRDERSVFDRPLRRARDRRVVAGVCGGLAEWLGWEVAFVRLAFGLAALMSLWGAGIVYGLAWIAIPEETRRRPDVPDWWDEDRF